MVTGAGGAVFWTVGVVAKGYLLAILPIFLDTPFDDLIKYLTIEWRVQKNGQNGQKVTFGDGPDRPEYSATCAGCRIYQRAKRLGMKPHEPLAVYLNKRGNVRYIIDSLVNGLLREAAGTTLNLQRNTYELSLWSTHSIRVTAANLLYRQ